MKLILPVAALCVHLCIAGDVVVERQGTTVATSSSATSSAYTPPTVLPNPTVNSSDHDLSQKFCRLWRHQSVYADGKIYVDGGNTYIPSGNFTFNTMPAGNYSQGMNDVLLVIDLSKNFSNQDTAPYSVIGKGPNVPNALIEGALWYSKMTRKVYQLGGWFSSNSRSDPGFTSDAKIPESSIWEFDIDARSWTQSTEFALSNTGSKIDRPGAAAYCDAPTLNQSFIFEGYVQRRSDQDYVAANYSTNSEFKFLEGMLSLDTKTSPPTLSNISVPTYIGPRMNGAMIHVPVGEQGVIVQIGGQVPVNPTAYGVGIPLANELNTNIGNDFVDIYDIKTGYWFRQQTYGGPDGIPTGRSDICTILVTAADQSSYNIFMIAGVDTYASVIANEEMWVLTLPTFQWAKVNTRPGGIYGHTCHAVGENLIVIGGMQTVNTGSSSGGNVNTCSSHMPAEIFSLAEMQYTGIFDAEGATRAPPVPADVINLIGGSSTGGAVIKSPALWNDTYLQYVFNPNLPRPAYTPTYTLAAIPTTVTSSTPTSIPTPVKSGSNIGAIVGGAVGGVVVLAVLVTLLYICMKRRSKSRLPPVELVGELPSYQESKTLDAVEVSGFNAPLHFTPYNPQSAHRNPAELQAAQEHDEQEERDVWRPLSMGPHSPSESEAGSPRAIPRRPVALAGSSPRFSEVSTASIASMRDSAVSGEHGGVSRQSQVSVSVSEQGRESRQSEVSN